MSPLAGKETWHSLPTTPAILSTATKYFDRAAYENHSSKRPASVTDTFSLMGALAVIILPEENWHTPIQISWSASSHVCL